MELFSMEEAYSFQVIGQAKEHIMYVAGGQAMRPNVESLAPMVTLEPDEGEIFPLRSYIDRPVFFSTRLFMYIV